MPRDCRSAPAESVRLSIQSVRVWRSYNRVPRRCIAALLGAAALIAGCSSGLTIRDARGTPAQVIPGTTPALATYLNGAEDHAIVVVVHGVGIHCPTYGLDKSNGWLNDDTTAALKLVPIGDVNKPEFISDADNRRGGAADPKSGLYLTRREFTFRRADKSDAHVLVAEITWSGLTAWIKSNQLAYDLSDAVPAGKPPAVSCPSIEEAINPFQRQYLNKVIKESTLDMALSDAVLYVGTYGAKIERGMAEVLCRITSTRTYDATQLCDWKNADPHALNSRFIFMTHSLGSRIVYDTLLDLSGTVSRGATSAFSADYRAVANPSTDQIVENTKAIYMFANQLPLLGLANIPVTLRSDDGPVPVLLAQVNSDLQHVPENAPTPTEIESKQLCGNNPIACFANLRVRSAGPKAAALGPLDIVAFGDPNDLLTYGVPPWYVRDVGNLNLHITNVTLQNATHWLGFIELPTSAHENYMLKDSAVWRVVRCGARDGSVNCDRR